MLTVCTGLMSDTNPARTCNVQTLKEVGVTKHLVYALKAEDSMAMCSMGCEDSELSSGGECPSGGKRSQGLPTNSILICCVVLLPPMINVKKIVVFLHTQNKG